MVEQNYPDYIQQRITDEFLNTFREELERIFVDDLPENPTYWNFYQWYDSTGGFYTALKIACNIHNFNDLYDYLDKLGGYYNDVLAGQLTELLYKRGLVDEGTVEDAYPLPYDKFELDDAI